jgi:hypothetical protein
MYTNCGPGVFTNKGIPPYKEQQGDTPTTGYNCWWNHENPGPDPENCFLYPVDKWVTFYYKIQIGNWGVANSWIQSWVAVDGGPYQQWINVPNYVLPNSHPADGYDYLTLTTYMTAKDPNVNHPTAHTWYDELIVSSQPINAPGVPPSSSPQPPAAPTNLSLK